MQQTPQFLHHCRAVSKLMKRLALLAQSLDDDCHQVTLNGGPYRKIKQSLLEAFGIAEAIRCAHLPEIDKEDAPTAFIMGLALDHLTRKIGTMADLLRQVQARQRAKYLTSSSPLLAAASN